MMCPATVPAATLSQSSGSQPNSWNIGAEGEPGVGDPAGDDDLGARGRSASTIGRHAEVGVGRQHLVADVGERPAGLHVLRAGGPAAISSSSSGRRSSPDDQADLQLAAQPELPRHLQHRLGAAPRIHAAGVRGDADALLRRRRGGSAPSAARSRARSRRCGSRDVCFCMMDIVTSAR